MEAERRLLVVEDDQRIAKLICFAAKQVGFKTRVAVGTKAIEAAYNEFNPDVITLDIIMPEMDGIEVLQFLRDKCSKARIVILSGSDGLSRRVTEKLGNALALPIEASLQKPFNIVEVQSVLKTIRAFLDNTQAIS